MDLRRVDAVSAPVKQRPAAQVPKSRVQTVAVSVVVPTYNEEDSVLLLQEQLGAVMEKLGRTYEIIYVDDGSRDATPKRLREAAERHPHVRVLRLRRNFGQTAALQAGIDASRGEVLIFMDGDLQNDPADIPLLLDKLDEGFDVVSGWRRQRHDSLSRRIPSQLANGLISWVTGVRLHDYGCTLKAYRREVIENVRLYGEMHRFIPAYAAWSGADIVEMPVTHHARRFGRSKYGLSRTLRVVLDLVTAKLLGSYSTKPIYFFGFFGFFFWVLGVLCGIEVIAERVFPPHTYAHSNPMLLLAVFLALLGMQFVLMGLLAELQMRTYHESQDKPTYVVRQVFGSDDN